jgi:glycosyltransferase involved in cell wall biosynthesis
MQVIPNFVDIDRWKPRPEKTLQSGPTKIAFVGRLVEPKNPLLLIEACAGLDVEIIMVGDGPLRSSVERYAREKEVNVAFVGQLPHDQIRDVIQHCFAFVLPSIYEGHPKTLIEAMAMAMPVIGTRVRGIADIIIDRQTGLLCEGDAESLRAAIMELKNDRAFGARLGLAARQYVLENFSLNRVARTEQALFEMLSARAN